MTAHTSSFSARKSADGEARLPFDEHLAQAMGGLGTALQNLLQSVDADPKTPQKVSRRFGINRNLAWKISRLISEQDVRASVRHVPGVQGVRILCDRFRDAGAPADVVDAVGSAMDGFLHMVEVQAGDRTALELTLRSLRPEGEGPEGVLAARKLAFQGNSAVWGVRARLKLGMQMVVPAARPDVEGDVDIASVGGLLDFWRLRADARWPLIHYNVYGDGALADQPRSKTRIEPIEGSEETLDGPPWLRDFCSVPLPNCRRVERVPGDLFEITEGPVGNTASLSCVYGRILRGAAPFFSNSPDQTGEYQLKLNTPVEGAHLDVLIHESLPLASPPRIVVESWMQVGDSPSPLGDPLYPLDVLEELEVLETGLADLDTPDIPRYPDLVRQVSVAMGHPLEEFRGYRLRMRYPPIPTKLRMIHPLPVR